MLTLFALSTTVQAQTLVQDIIPGAASSYPYITTDLNNELFFSVSAPTIGSDVYKFDGTTVSLALPTNPSTGDTPSQLTAFNGKLYFTYFDNNQLSGEYNGFYEWNGDVSSTPTLISELNPAGTDRILLSRSKIYDNKLYFSGQSQNNQPTLWVYDGMTPPQKVVDVYTGSGLVSLGSPANLTVWQNKLFFQATEGGEVTFFSFDGVSAPTAEFTNFYNSHYEAGGFPTHNNKMYGVGQTDLSNAQTRTLFEYDGINPPLLVDNNILAGQQNYINYLINKTVFDVLYFSTTATTGGSSYQWEYDFTNPAQLTTVADNLDTGPLVEGGFAYVVADGGGSLGLELIKTDGVNRTVLTDINPNGDSFNNNRRIYSWNSKLYFSADDGSTGFELHEYSTALGLTKIEKDALTVHPNPAQNQLFIEVENEEVSSINIIDFSGRIVLSMNENKSVIDVSNLVSGVYIVSVQTANGIGTKRFVKQ